MIQKVDVVTAVTVVVAHNQAAAVIVKVDLESRALFAGNKTHLKPDASFAANFQESSSRALRVAGFGVWRGRLAIVVRLTASADRRRQHKSRCNEACVAEWLRRKDAA